MKKNFLRFILFVLLIWPVYGVSQNQVITDTSSVIRKGIIKFTDGTSAYFEKLKFVKDSVSWLGEGNTIRKEALNGVITIKKITTSAGIGAMVGLPLGLLVGAGMAKGVRNGTDFLVTLFSLGTVTDVDTKREETNAYILSTCFITGVGILVGALIKREIVVYPPLLKAVSFQPVLLPAWSGPPVLAFSYRIGIR